MSKIPHRLYPTEDQMPQKWLNLRSAMAEQPDPLFYSGALRPSGVDDPSPIFREELTRQELGDATVYVDIPEPVQNVYKMYRPSPPTRAYELEKALDTSARIYYKFGENNTPGSHKLNSAVIQAYCAKMQGLTSVTTETGAGQRGAALSEACSYFGLTCDVFMARCSYKRKLFRKAVMNVFGVSITPSSSPMTEMSRQISCDHPETTGSLGCAISEVAESVVRNGGAKRYVLDSVFSQVLLHQSIIGLESKLAMEQLEECPDVAVGRVGGGSNLGGLIAPFMADKLWGIRNLRIAAVGPASCPSLARGKYAHSFCDTGWVTPLAWMYTLGCGFIPFANHVGGLRYHDMSPILFELYYDGYMEAVACEQTRIFEAAALFAKREIILPASESTRAIREAIDEALRCRENHEAKTILFGPTGTGYFDIAACENYFNGEVSDSTFTDVSLQKGFDNLPKTFQNEGI